MRDVTTTTDCATTTKASYYINNAPSERVNSSNTSSAAVDSTDGQKLVLRLVQRDDELAAGESDHDELQRAARNIHTPLFSDSSQSSVIAPLRSDCYSTSENTHLWVRHMIISLYVIMWKIIIEAIGNNNGQIE